MLSGAELDKLGIPNRLGGSSTASIKNPIDAKMIAEAKKDRDSAKAELDKFGKGKKEVFRASKPLSNAQINKPLTEEEQAKLGEVGRLPNHANYQREVRLISKETDPSKRTQKLAELNRKNPQVAAYEKIKKEMPDISPAEYAVMQNYTKGDGYILSNAAARGHMEDPNSDSAKAGVAQARLIHAALGKLPDWKGEVRRDSRQSKQQFEQDYQVGKKVTFHGVTSTTSDLSGKATAAYGDAGKKQSEMERLGYSKKESSKASTYDQTAKKLGVKTLPQEDSVNVEYRMKVKSGKSISPLSVAPKEAEIALRHGWTGTIAKIEEVDGKKIVYLEED